MRSSAVGIWALFSVCPALVTCDFRVQFDVMTTVGEGSFVVRVHEDWAPIGAARFKELVEGKFYDDIRFFRVIPTFMVQFGLNGDPAKSKDWSNKHISDDPVKASNKLGHITFAKSGEPNSRTTQIFINYVDNADLDQSGFAPFGEVEGDGMTVVRQIYDCQEEPKQGQIMSMGNRYLDNEFPDLSKIVKAQIIEEGIAATSDVAGQSSNHTEFAVAGRAVQLSFNLFVPLFSFGSLFSLES